MKVKSAELRIQSHYKEMVMCPFMSFKNCNCCGGQVQEGAKNGDRESNYADIRGASWVHKNGKGFSKDGQTLTEKETRG